MLQGSVDRLKTREVVPHAVVIWCVLAAITAVGFHRLDAADRRFYGELDRHGAQVMGRITGLRPQEHGSIAYTYVVRGLRYTAGNFTGGPRQDVDGYRLGAPVTVTYVSTAPTISCACNAHEDAKGSSWPSELFTGLFVSTPPLAVTLVALEPRFALGRKRFRPIRSS